MELIDGVVDVTLRGEVVESLAQPLLSEAAPEGQRWRGDPGG